MPLQRFGTGFLKGLTQVAGQAKADLRAEEDTESRNNLAMAQLALQSGDPTLIQGALDRLTDDFGGGKKRTGGKKGTAGGAGGGDPKSMIAQLLLGGLDRGDGGAAAGGQAPLRIQTAEEKTQAEIAKTQQLDEATIARLRRAGVPPEQLALIMQQLAGAPVGPTGFAPAGSVPFTAGVAGEQIPPRPTAPANLQLVQRNRPGDPQGAPPSDFLFAPDTGQLFNMDRSPVTEALETRRAPRQPQDPVTAEINRLRLANLQETAASRKLYQAIPSNYRFTFDRAVASLTPEKRSAQRAIVAELWEAGKTQAVEEFTRQMAVEGEGVTMQGLVEGRRAAIRQLDDLDAALTELEQAGVDTGPVSGRVEDLARRIGTSTDPRLVALGNQMLVALQSYRLAVTGVQFGFNESQQYEGMFPNYRNQLPVNRAQLAGLRRAMSLNQQGFWVDKLGEEGAALVGAPGADSGLRLRARQFLLTNEMPTDSRNIDALIAIPEADWSR